MRKKMSLILLLTIAAALLVGCSNATIEKSGDHVPQKKTSMFIEVEQTGYFIVVYDKKTKVMYAVSESSSNMGNFTMLCNADGTPRLWEE